MLDVIDLGDDLGFVTVQIGGVEQRLDLFEEAAALSKLSGQHDGEVGLFNAAVAQRLRQAGFPEVSHLTADRFASGIFARLQTVREEIKKKGSACDSASSPASTASGRQQTSE